MEELTRKAEYKSPLLKVMPKGGKTYDYTDYIAEIDELKEIIERNLRKIQSERLRLENYIDSIDESRIRLIFRLRHINCMTWAEIGDEVGYTYEGVRKVYKKELKKLK